MNPKYMQLMSAEELEQYAQALGFTAKAAPTAEGKVELITSRRERSVEIGVLGLTVAVPMKAMRDKRVTDLLNKEGRGEEDLDAAFRIVLGKAQQDAIVAACTDPDGTVDNVALGLAYGRILNSEELKNF